MSNLTLQMPTEEFYQGLHKWGDDVLTHFDDYPEIRHRVIVWHRRARKTTLALNLLLRECNATKNRTYAHVLPTFRQAKQVLWLDPNMLKRYMPEQTLKKAFNQTELVAEFNSGCVLHLGGADDPDRWRGMGCYGWVLDEFATMPNGRQMYQEIILPIIHENGGWVMFIYTPKGRTHGWEFFQKAQANRNWQEWFLPVTESGILDDEKIEEIRDDQPAHIFSQEYLCEFLIEGGGVIKRIRQAIVGNLEKGRKTGRYILGVDLGKKVDYTVLTALNCDTRHVDGHERFQTVDWAIQKERIARMAREYNNALIVMDTTGGTELFEDALVSDLEQLGLNVQPFKITTKTKQNIIHKMIIAIEDRRVTYPHIQVLIDELTDFDINERGRYGAPAGLHDDCVISLALAIEGLGAAIYGKMPDAEKLYVSYNQMYPKASGQFASASLQRSQEAIDRGF